MLKRISTIELNKKLEKNKNWKILDVGCGFRANKHATVLADKQDFSNFYKDKKFVQIREKKLPFKDKEFDFVISSHVIEHVDDFEFFIKELERISLSGYIELPTRLGDNLVFENEKDHIWWFFFDDTKKELVASQKKQLIEPFITVSMAKYLEEVFNESFIIQLIWENKIEYSISDKTEANEIKKISFFKIIKKYLSKRLRSIIR